MNRNFEHNRCLPHKPKPTPMTKTKTILTLISTFCLISCLQKNTESKKQDKLTGTIQIDTSVFVVLPLETDLPWIFKTGKPTQLTTEDLLKIETILKKCIDEYNPDEEKQFMEMNAKHPDYKLDKNDYVIDLKRYKRQYMAIINPKGEKEVWINCFCGQWNERSRTDPVIFDDGGNCYFNLKINLATGKYSEMMVNAEA